MNDDVLLENTIENDNLELHQQQEADIYYEELTNTINTYSTEINTLDRSVTSLQNQLDTVSANVYTQFSTMQVTTDRTNYLLEFNIVLLFTIVLLLIVLVFRGVKK